MPETAENVAHDFEIEREAQDRMALASQRKAVAAQQSGFFEAEIVPVLVPQRKGDALVFAKDEHPRETSLEALARLKGVSVSKLKAISFRLSSIWGSGRVAPQPTHAPKQPQLDTARLAPPMQSACSPCIGERCVRGIGSKER